MKISSQLKLINDEYDGFYSCGLTMLNSGTMGRFATESDTDEKTVMKSDNGLILTVAKEKDSKTGTTHITTTVENAGTEPVSMEMLASFVISEIEGDKLHRFLSFWSAEGRHKVDRLNDLNMEHAWNNMAYRIEKFGNVGGMPVRKYFPFVAVEDSKTGKFTAVSLYSPSSWQIEVVIRHDDRVTLAGGIADRDFGHWTKKLNPGEVYTAPKAVLAEGTSLLEVCDKLVKSQHPDISPVDDHMGIAFNEYCTTWGNPTEENMIKIADKLEGHGIQYLVMDSGWYVPDGFYWWNSCGDWEINYNRFPNGLKPVADYIRSKGMIPGLWYEFESVSPMSKIYDDPEMVMCKDGKPLTVMGRRFPNMVNPKVKQYLLEKVAYALRDWNFGYIKVDYNDSTGIGCDGPDSLGENLRNNILATQDFFRKMREVIPDLVIENCSSGGHRLEASMMELSSMASFSDAHEIVSLPIIAANLHYLVRPEQSQIWSVLRAADSDARIYFSMCATFLGRMGLSGDIYDLSDHQWELVDGAISLYKEVSDIIKDGTTTCVISEPEYYNDPCGSQMVVRTLGNRSLVIYHRFKNSFGINEFVRKHNVLVDLSLATAKYGVADSDFSAEIYILER